MCKNSWWPLPVWNRRKRSAQKTDNRRLNRRPLLVGAPDAKRFKILHQLLLFYKPQYVLINHRFTVGKQTEAEVIFPKQNTFSKQGVYFEKVHTLTICETCEKLGLTNNSHEDSQLQQIKTEITTLQSKWVWPLWLISSFIFNCNEHNSSV